MANSHVMRAVVIIAIWMCCLMQNEGVCVAEWTEVELNAACLYFHSQFFD
jgi:hypothetical protein